MMGLENRTNRPFHHKKKSSPRAALKRLDVRECMLRSDAVLRQKYMAECPPNLRGNRRDQALAGAVSTEVMRS